MNTLFIFIANFTSVICKILYLLINICYTQQFYTLLGLVWCVVALRYESTGRGFNS